MINNLLVFNIQTIPDISGIRLLHSLPDELADADVAEWMMKKCREKNNNDFMPLHLHKIIAISYCLQLQDHLHLSTIGLPEKDDEKEIIEKFFDITEKYRPILMSWNGSDFDLPVLNYRSLIHSVSADIYWEENQEITEYKNHANKHHIDLGNVLSKYQIHAGVPRNELAKLCGFPHQSEIKDSHIWTAYQEGKIKEIRDFCETNVANTYLIYLRHCLMRKKITNIQHQQYIDIFFQKLKEYNSKHWQAFCTARV